MIPVAPVVPGDPVFPVTPVGPFDPDAPVAPGEPDGPAWKQRNSRQQILNLCLVWMVSPLYFHAGIEFSWAHSYTPTRYIMAHNYPVII